MPRMIKACLLQIPCDIRRLWIRRVWLTKYLSTPLAVMASVCTISSMLENGRKSCLPGWTIRRIEDRKSTRLNSSHVKISYAVFCLKKKKRRSVTIGGKDGEAENTSVMTGIPSISIQPQRGEQQTAKPRGNPTEQSRTPAADKARHA